MHSRHSISGTTGHGNVGDGKGRGVGVRGAAPWNSLILQVFGVYVPVGSGSLLLLALVIELLYLRYPFFFDTIPLPYLWLRDACNPAFSGEELIVPVRVYMLSALRESWVFMMGLYDDDDDDD